VFWGFVAAIMSVSAVCLWNGQRDHSSFSTRTAQRIIAEAGLERALWLSVSGDRTDWQRIPLCADRGLLGEAVALMQRGTGKKISGHGAPTPEEIWFFVLGDGREVAVGWWDLDRPDKASATITGNVYGYRAAMGDRLIRVDRQSFDHVRERILQECWSERNDSMAAG